MGSLAAGRAETAGSTTAGPIRGFLAAVPFADSAHAFVLALFKLLDQLVLERYAVLGRLLGVVITDPLVPIPHSERVTAQLTVSVLPGGGALTVSPLCDSAGI
ncbi:hypothetical protein ACFYWN_29260 [Streptomyces sp. NPDC002917]|uniref:hypothetical protein n=1 Tax=Streptomyces sp. NPDC002917 TaxID=3364671 RepID=UPI003699658F